MDPRTDICYCCGVDCTTKRSLAWDLRPRSKDLARGHKRELTTLDVVLCDDCYKRHRDVTLIGWDRWDALDGIESPCVLCGNTDSYIFYFPWNRNGSTGKLNVFLCDMCGGNNCNKDLSGNTRQEAIERLERP